jgi:hypothetical protein
MEVLELPAYDFQIGMDRFHDFGFGIHGLPNPLPSTPAKAKAMSYIQSALDANAAIPLNSYCPVPEMKVHLPVPPNTIIHRRQRPFAEQQQSIVDDTVTRWLNEGIICTAAPGTPHNNPPTLAAKKDLEGNRSAHRVCLDPRLLNAHLPDDNFPIPLVSDIMNKIEGHAVFTTLDLRQAYHRSPINEDDRPLTTFTHRGQQYM